MDASPGLDWVQLAGAIGQRGGGTHAAEQALEYLLGGGTIDAAVDLVVALDPGWELAESVLVHLRSRRALDRAYHIYQTANGERKRLAIWLIMHLARHEALAWISEFLADADVAPAGIDVLDQLVFASVADPDSDEVEALLAQAERHADEYVRQKAAYIREYVRHGDAVAE